MTETALDVPADMESEAVTVAYVHQNDVTYSWHHSLLELVVFDMFNFQRVRTGGYVAMRCGSDGLVEARNKVVREFLATSKADWLWWVDTDMGFPPDVLERLLDAADPQERPIVGGLCFSQRETVDDGMGGWRTSATPTIFDWVNIQEGGEEKSGFAVRWDFPSNALIRCSGTGMACVLIHRSVFERIAEQYGPIWYNRVPNPSTGQIVSEDLSMCMRALALDIPVHIHTGVVTTHAKRLWVQAEDYWRQRAVDPPPAPLERPKTWTVPRYAIVPTHNRPERLLSLVASLGRQCDMIVIVDNASTPPVDVETLRVAASDARVEVIRDEEQPPNLARFWNVMFDRCAELAKESGDYGWDVAVFNDDAIVPAGWYDACADGLRDNPKAVIAHTNPTTPALLTDLHNDPNNRMCPHAFVIRGEAGMRADEDMRWWYFDSDLDQRARLAGGVLSVPGPQVVNSLANTTTVGLLAEQAQKDAETFGKKWANR